MEAPPAVAGNRARGGNAGESAGVLLPTGGDAATEEQEMNAMLAINGGFLLGLSLGLLVLV